MNQSVSELDAVINGLRQLPKEELGLDPDGKIVALLGERKISFWVKMSEDGGLYNTWVTLTAGDGTATLLEADQVATEKLWKLQRKAVKNGQRLSKLDLIWSAKKRDEVSRDPRIRSLREQLAREEGELEQEIEKRRGQFMDVAGGREI